MSLKRRIEDLGPYQSLFLLAVPTATVEPLKLVAVAVAAEGHWIAGTAMIVTCYLLSLVLVERLFIIVEPKLLTIPWFAKFWTTVLAVRTWIAASFRSCVKGRVEWLLRQCRSISTAIRTRSEWLLARSLVLSAEVVLATVL